MKNIIMKKIYLLTSVFLFLGLSLIGQRYTDEVFTDEQIVLTSDVHYATNATIFPLLFLGESEFLPEPLMMDVYEPDPEMDTVANRPVVLVVHGGDALPRIVNGACWGDKTDSVTVVTARKLARMGYVAVAPNYRLGWNPLATTQDAFLDGLVDAGVRIQQDLRACARFLRMDEAELGNTYGVHPDKIALWGTSSSAGTYSGFAAYINEVEELQTPTYFVTDTLGNVFNTFNEMEAGNIDGTVVGMNALGDTTNYVNWPDYSSDFQLAALGSAISLDSGAVDADEPPLIMFGNPTSVVTQFPEGPIQLPTTGEVVAFAQLSQGFIAEAVAKGLNDEWLELNDKWTMAQRADPNFGTYEGWLPLYGDPDNEYPWVWWDEVNCPASESSFEILPAADRDLGLLQIDTMANYFGVRACITLDLDCDLQLTSTRNNILEEGLISMSPNPSAGYLQIESTNSNRIIKNVSIHAMDGKLMRHFQVENHLLREDDLNLPKGLYSVIIRFEDGIVPKKLMIN